MAVDVDTGEYEVDVNTVAAGDRLRARLPEAQIWFVRVGYPYVYRFGHEVRP